MTLPFVCPRLGQKGSEVPITFIRGNYKNKSDDREGFVDSQLSLQVSRYPVSVYVASTCLWYFDANISVNPVYFVLTQESGYHGGPWSKDLIRRPS